LESNFVGVVFFYISRVDGKKIKRISIGVYIYRE
jgi:hypothetical protein